MKGEGIYIVPLHWYHCPAGVGVGVRINTVGAGVGQSGMEVRTTTAARSNGFNYILRRAANLYPIYMCIRVQPGSRCT